MGRITLGGLMSGINTDNLLQKLLDADSLRIKAQDAKKRQISARQAAWSEVRASLTALRSTLDAIRLTSTFRARTASVSNIEAASVTATAGTTLQTHNLSISKLAQSHSIAGKSTFVTADDPVGADAAGSFTIGVGAVTRTITVTATDTLNSLRDNIRAQSGDLVSAEVVKVQDPTTLEDRYRLVLTSKTMGAAGGITLTADPASPNILEQTGLGFTTSGTLTNVISDAQDSEFTLDGQSYKRPSNVIADVIGGLSITLKSANATTPVTTTITVSQNQDAVANSVQAWVDGLNAALSGLKAKTSYDPQTRKAAVLADDPLARQLLNSMKGMLSNVVAGQPSNLDSLSDVGITTGAYGTADFGKVLLDKAKLTAQLGQNEDGVARLFGALRTNLGLSTTNPAATVTATSYDQTDPTKYRPENAFNDIVAADRWGTAGGGWKSADAPTPAAPQYLTLNMGSIRSVDNVTLFLPANVTTTGLRNFELQYSTDSTDGLTDGTWTKIDGVTDNVSTYKSFDFQAVQAKWVRLKITDTYGTSEPAKVLEMQVHESTNAPGLAMYKYVNTSLTSTTGTIAARDGALNRQVKDIDSRLERMLNQMSKREDLLRKQFARMEATLARFQAQGSAMLGQISNLTANR